jgi:hypothetical protein
MAGVSSVRTEAALHGRSGTRAPLIAVLVSALALLAAIIAPKYVRGEAFLTRIAALEPHLRRYGPVAAAVVSIAVVWFVWDAFLPIAKVHDESSYLLQAEIFARGRWTVPTPPLPEFFEQPHVQVVPAVASKYPPGHALLLTLGALVGFPPLVPLLLTGITAALLFALAARLANPWVAVLTWIVWLSAPMVLRFQPSYFSELTTGALLLASWWALLEWRETRRRRWLLVLALAIGWGAITRPLTMLALAIPIGVIVIRDVVRLRLWRDFGLAVGVGVAVLSLLPLWSARTTGDWRVSPIEKYRKDYLPFDKVGFTPDTSPPRRMVTPVLKYVNDYYIAARKAQRLEALPRIVMDRLAGFGTAFFGGGARWPLLAVAIAGLFFMPGALRFAAVSALALFCAYLPYAFWSGWTVYYLEITPVLAAITAIGIWGVAQRVLRSEPRSRQSVLIAAAVVAVIAWPAIQHWRGDHRSRSALDRRFFSEIKRLPRPAIVFIQYSPRFPQHMAVVFNSADLDAEPVWVVHHRGARNEELRRLVPNRQSFDFEEEQLVRALSR